MTQVLELLTVNISGKVRRDTLFGRDYLVAPLSMIVPGVLNGSKGPLMYTMEEISRDYDSWNGMPVVVNHPVDEYGDPTSARHPRTLEKYGIGNVFSATINGKLGAEGWFDSERTKILAPTVYSRLIKDEAIEGSTGVFTDNIPVKNGENNTFDGKSFVAYARNLRPDHMAVLPDKVGACSVKDGCGINVNEKTGGGKCSCDDAMKSKGHKCDDCKKNDKIPPVGNESQTNWWDLASTSVTTNALPSDDVEADKACKILKDGKANGKTLTRKQRGMFGAACSKKSTHNSLTINNEGKAMPLTEKQKKQMVDNLIGNCDMSAGEQANKDGPRAEEDRKALNSLPEPKLIKLEQQRALAANTIDPDPDDGVDDDDDDEGTDAGDDGETQDDDTPTGNSRRGKKRVPITRTPVSNKAKKPRNVKEWLVANGAPPEVVSAVSNAVTFEQEQKKQLIKKITENERNTFNREFLMGKQVEELRAIANLIGNGDDDAPVTTTFLGSAVPITMNRESDFNSQDQDMIPDPIDWGQPVTADDMD